MERKYLDLIRALVATPSISSQNPTLDQSNRAVVELLADSLDGVASSIRILPLVHNDQKVNLVVRVGPRDNSEPGLVLSGHSDTVPYDAEHWTTDPFVVTEKEGRLYGLGTSDMKAFFAAVLAALDSLDISTIKRPLSIIATADEESSMVGARELFAEFSCVGSLVLIGEPTDLVPIRAHKGTVAKSIIITGSSGHSSDPASGNSALEAMYDVISMLMDWREDIQMKFFDSDFSVPYPTLNFGCISGGDSFNRICSACELQIDVRILPSMSTTDIERDIDKIARKVASERRVAIKVDALFDPVPPLSDHLSEDLVQHCERITGRKSQCASFTTEGPFFLAKGGLPLILGPGKIEQAHKPDEFVEVANLDAMTTIIRDIVVAQCA